MPDGDRKSLLTHPNLLNFMGNYTHILLNSSEIYSIRIKQKHNRIYFEEGTMYSVKLFDKTAANKIAKEMAIPTVYFQHGVVLDWKSKTPIPQPMIDELKTRIPEFTALWKEKGKPLLRTAMNYLGKEFTIKELGETVTQLPVSLILDPDNTPMSYPLVVPVRRQLACLPADEPKRTREFFIHNVLVLLLFRYLHENFSELDERSELLTKYAAEPPRTKNSLFPLAIIQHVYQLNGRGDELKQIRDKEINDPLSLRTLEIIKEEGYLTFLTELSNYETLKPQPITPP